jgi:hypothetical protein
MPAPGVSLLSRLKNENSFVSPSKKTLGSQMKNKYDPELLLAEARKLREKAAAADPIMRAVYRTRAAECEVRASISLHTPIVKENAAHDERLGDEIEAESEESSANENERSRVAAE